MAALGQTLIKAIQRESFMYIPLQALTRKNPSCVMGEKARSTTGRVCPLHVSGVCRAMAGRLGKATI